MNVEFRDKFARASLLAICAVGAVGAACGGDGGSSTPDAAIVNDAPIVVDAPIVWLAPPPEGQGLQVEIQGSVDAGERATFCGFFPLPAGRIDVGKIEHRYTDGLAGHLVMYPTNSAPAVLPPNVIRNCTAELVTDAQILPPFYGAHTAEGVLELPVGVGLPLGDDRGLSLYVEYHVSNPGAATSVQAAVNLWLQPGPLVGEAGALYFQSTLIAVPAGGSSRTRSRCALPEGVSLVRTQPHMHSHGTAFTAELQTEGSAAVALTTGLGAVPFAPALETTTGQRIDYACDYTNDTAAPLLDGLTPADGERCSLITTYYVPAGTRLPLLEEICISDENVVHTGDQACLAGIACTQDTVDWTSESGFTQFMLCRTQLCETSGHQHEAMQTCIFENCEGVCNNTGVGHPRLGEPECDACATTNCAAERAACEAATCP